MQSDKIPAEIESEARDIAEELLGTIWRQRDVKIIARALMTRDKRAAEIANKLAWEVDARPEHVAKAILTYGGSDEQR